jgi:crotonobetainyl-CoA:carnitine CoA-transferase CaiB-like acyl-CoA transferase
MAHAFEGLRILDFSQVLAGPAATHFFAMLGADVIKVENPASGDQFRNLMTTEALADYGMSPGFMTLNTGKRSVAIDLKHPDARDVVLRIARTADVVVENFRAGVIVDLGFGYEAIAKVRPDIVYCSISGYGQSGPMRGAAAYDGAIQAASGMMSVNGHPETGPTRTSYTVVDMSTALTAAFAISSALYRRRETGEGQRLDVAMYDTALWMMAPLMASHMVGREEFGLMGNNSPAMTPTANVFQTADGHIQITALTDGQGAALVALLGLDPHADPRLQTIKTMSAHHDAVRQMFADRLAQETTGTWAARLRVAKVPHAPVRDFEAAVTDPQLAHRGILQDVPAPKGSTHEAPDPLRLIAAAFTANADGPAIFRAPPALGQHNKDVLMACGYSVAEVAALREAGVFGAA